MKVVIASIALSISLLSTLAYSHEAPNGWSYPMNCCSGLDCRQVASTSIGENTVGYIILKTGEVIPYHGDPRLKSSPDGEYHWCSVRGEETTGTVCLFVPPPGS